jgi:hypothetical protein
MQINGIISILIGTKKIEPLFPQRERDGVRGEEETNGSTE